MLASGVRRSCDTASSSADFSASLWRAISVWVAARREVLPPERERELVGGKRQQAGLLPGRQPGIERALGPQPAEGLLVGLHPDLQELGRRSGPGDPTAAAALVGLHPPRRLIAGRPGEARAERRRRQGLTGSRIRDDDLAVRAVGDDPGAVEADVPDEALDDAGAGGLEVRRRREETADREERRRIRRLAGRPPRFAPRPGPPAGRRRSRRTGTAAGRAIPVDRRPPA